MRIDTSPRHKNAPRPAEKSAPAFLQWLRGRSCAVAPTNREECSARIEAAHTYGAGDKGMSTKNSDRYAIPLCSAHHAEQHARGWKTFERDYGISSAPLLAEQYWRAWPGRLAWEKKQESSHG